MQNDDNLNWNHAKEHLYEVERQYIKIGFAGSLALNLIIRPLIDEFEEGVRTKQLYYNILELE